MKQENNDQSIFNTFVTTLGKVPLFLSAIILATSIAYLVGFFQAKAYYDTFGIGALVSELSNSELLFFSWFPLVMVGYFIWLGVCDLVVTEKTKQECSRRKASFFIVKYGWWILILLNVIGYYLEKKGWIQTSSIITIVASIGYAFLAGASFERIVIELHENRQRLNIMTARYILVFLILGLYYVPTSIGREQAKRDLSPDTTNLLKIKLKGETKNLYSLRINGSHVFGVSLESKGSNYKPQISIYDTDEVEFFQKNNN